MRQKSNYSEAYKREAVAKAEVRGNVSQRFYALLDRILPNAASSTRLNFS